MCKAIVRRLMWAGVAGAGLQEHRGGGVQAAVGHDHAQPPAIQPLLGGPPLCTGKALLLHSHKLLMELIL